MYVPISVVTLDLSQSIFFKQTIYNWNFALSLYYLFMNRLIYSFFCVLFSSVHLEIIYSNIQLVKFPEHVLYLRVGKQARRHLPNRQSFRQTWNPLSPINRHQTGQASRIPIFFNRRSTRKRTIPPIASSGGSFEMPVNFRMRMIFPPEKSDVLQSGVRMTTLG